LRSGASSLFDLCIRDIERPGRPVPLPVRIRTAADLVVVVEPWADEVALGPGKACDVVAIGSERPPALSVDPSSYGLVVWVEAGGSTFEVWQGGKQLVFPTRRCRHRHSKGRLRR